MAKNFWDNQVFKRLHVVLIYDDRNKITSSSFGPMAGKIVTLQSATRDRATTVLVDYSAGCVLRPRQEKSCNGSGYNKQNAALDGMKFGYNDREVTLTEMNWKEDLAKVGFKTITVI